jgi:hypothetical protein
MFMCCLLALYFSVLHQIDYICRREPLHRSFGRHVACRWRPTSSETVQLCGQWRSAISRFLGPIQWQEGRQQPELGGLGQVSDCECIPDTTNIAVVFTAENHYHHSVYLASRNLFSLSKCSVLSSSMLQISFLSLYQEKETNTHSLFC